MNFAAKHLGLLHGLLPGVALGEADVGAFSKQMELALFYDAKLEVAAS